MQTESDQLDTSSLSLVQRVGKEHTAVGRFGEQVNGSQADWWVLQPRGGLLHSTSGGLGAGGGGAAR